MHLSFVIPVFNEQDTLADLVAGILEHAAPHHCEILLIDDGSTDDSYARMCALAEAHEAVQAVRFRRNFGKAAALVAGFARAQGDCVFTMDADLQDDPKEIPRFLAAIKEGYDVVSGWKRRRLDPWHKTFPSRVFNAVLARLYGLELHDINCGFKAYRGEVVKRVPIYGERHRLIPALAAQMGYRVGEIAVEHHPRRFGQSKYGFERFSRGALDALAVWFLGRYRYAPGHFFGQWALASAFAGGGLLLAGVLVAWLVPAPVWGAVLIALGAAGKLGAAAALGLGLLAELAVEQRGGLDPAALVAEEQPPKEARKA